VRVISGVPRTGAQPGSLSPVAGFLQPFSWRVPLPQRGASTHTPARPATAVDAPRLTPSTRG